MATVTAVRDFKTIAELLDYPGVPASRVRFKPAPGTATEQDMLDVRSRERTICELVAGTLVEKTVGARESYLAWWIGHLLGLYLDRNDIGYCLTTDGMLRIAPHMVRIPDVSCLSRERLGGRSVPPTPVLGLYPDLAVEVISDGNTRAEMERKRLEYLDAGVPLIWYVDPRPRTVRVFTSTGDMTALGVGDILDGGTVLPGLALPVGQIFERLT